jgi:hypothetical protein
MSRTVKRIVIATTDPRATFRSTCTDGTTHTYRLAIADVQDDGEVWLWSAQQTKTGRDYKSGMGVTNTVSGCLDMRLTHPAEHRAMAELAMEIVQRGA